MSLEEQLQDGHHHGSPLADPDCIYTADLSQAGHLLTSGTTPLFPELWQKDTNQTCRTEILHE
jgi:hypothetical protein